MCQSCTHNVIMLFVLTLSLASIFHFPCRLMEMLHRFSEIKYWRPKLYVIIQTCRVCTKQRNLFNCGPCKPEADNTNISDTLLISRQINKIKRGKNCGILRTVSPAACIRVFAFYVYLPIEFLTHRIH
jgi:hypothetical protein